MANASKVVLVTGAARGIGLATAKRFQSGGAAVAMLDIDQPTLQPAAASLAQTGEVLALVCDVADPLMVEKSVASAVEHFGRLDALVNNAGIAVFEPILQTSYEQWRRVMQVNLDGTFLCAQACMPHLAKSAGAIVNIGSISGLRASTLRVAYGTSKAAIAHLTRQQAAEWAELGVRVNAVAPGPVDTAMAKAVHSADIRAAYHDAIPLNRYGTEAEIAEAIHYLCSPAASYITGQILAVDGGFEATGIGLPALRDI